MGSYFNAVVKTYSVANKQKKGGDTILALRITMLPELKTGLMRYCTNENQRNIRREAAALVLFKGASMPQTHSRHKSHTCTHSDSFARCLCWPVSHRTVNRRPFTAVQYYFSAQNILLLQCFLTAVHS